MANSVDTLGRANVRTRLHGWRADYQPDRRRAWYWHFIRSPIALCSLGILGLVATVSLCAPLIAPHDPRFIDPSVRLTPPSSEYWFGTDDLGRDIFSRLIYGGRTSLVVAVSVMATSGVIGALLGLLAGYYRRLDGIIMRTMDGFMAFPGVLLAIAVVMSLGARLSSVIIALTLVYVPAVARLARSVTLTIRELPYVEAARSIGLSDRAILWRYILSNALSPLIVQATFVAAFSILAEASLSFLGASISPETPTWGNMLRDGQRLLARAWWISVAPGCVLFVTVLSCTLLGDAVRDALDPRTRERRDEGIVG